MAFEPDKWKNGEAGGTPITAAELNRIEAAGAAKAAQGPEGPEGPQGPTETQWNDLGARVDALEANAGA